MRELCGLDEPRVRQESRNMFMNASEPRGILRGFIQIVAATSIEISQNGILGLGAKLTELSKAHKSQKESKESYGNT